ncbi:MAG: ChbG/HpnK family deacetylase [Betaproteobacteria bacterium]
MTLNQTLSTSDDNTLTPVCLCADDFGLTPGINSGIIELARIGRLSATSCMSTGSHFAQEAPTLLDLPIQTGLHLNLTEPLEGKRFYQPLAQLLRNSYLRRLDPDVITGEIDHQLDAFENTLGRAPDYVDGHQHVHQYPIIRDCLIKVLVRRYPQHRPWLRSTAPGKLAGLPLNDQFKAWFIGFLGSRALGKIAAQHRFPMNPSLLGVYGLSGGEIGYRQLLESWLSNASANELIMCHPAQVDDPSDAIGLQRTAEYAVFSGSDFPARLEHHGLILSKRSNTPG